jgi:hypothetical protein
MDFVIDVPAAPEIVISPTVPRLDIELGVQGPAGKNGASIRTGIGAPTLSVGQLGDLYVDTESGDLYAWSAAGYEHRGNLRGPRGLQGLQGERGLQGETGAASMVPGPQGERGIQGERGERGFTGADSVVPGPGVFVGEATPILAAPLGALYLNVVTGELFERLAGWWQLRGNLRGQTGSTGQTGERGLPGSGTYESGIYRAAETISALRVVRVDDVGELVLCRPPEPEATAPIGITETVVAAGADTTVRVAGPMHDASWSWQPGPVLLGIDGHLTQSAADLPFLVVVGQAVSPTSLVVRINAPVFTT